MMNSNRMYYSREAEVQAARERLGIAVACALLGLGVGTILAVLFAPSSSQKIRAEIARALEDGLTNSRDAVEPTVKRIGKEFGDLRHKVEERIS
jgi:gas vesicle protein